jgi:peptidoglycan/xylan/chitin deacetylase (PgdA/CDA1 family)
MAPDQPRHMANTPRSRLAMLVVGALLVTATALLVEARRRSVEGSVTGESRAAVPTTSAEPTTTTSTLPPPMTLQPLPAEPGLAPVITRVETNDPVVFLTIDDGLTRLPEGLAAFEQLGMPASLFLINEPIETDPEFFRSLPGTLVEAHTRTHANLTGLSQEKQEAEICANADTIERIYGRRPVLFRPPGGSYNEATRRAAAACGMRAIVIWEENVNWDVIGFRSVQHFRPGDIILMHFRPQFVEELNVIRQRIDEAGLRFALLEDYLAPETVPANLER